MKTFVPFAGCSFEEGVLRSLMCLDDKRLGKQRVETYQIWKMVRGHPYDNTTRPADHAALKPAAWSKHPAVHQWVGYADALALYLLKNMEIWEQRVSPLTGKHFDNSGMNENVKKWRIAYQEHDTNQLINYDTVRAPHWWSDPRIHDSDKGILYRKDQRFYSMFKRYSYVYEQYVWPSQLETAASRLVDLSVHQSTDQSTSQSTSDEHPVPQAKKRKAKVKIEPVQDQEPQSTSQSAIQSTNEQSETVDKVPSKKRSRAQIKSEPVDPSTQSEKENQVNSSTSKRGRKRVADAAAPLQLRRSSRAHVTQH